MKSRLLELGAASTPMQPVPAQDILTFLRAQPWSQRALKGAEISLLKDANKFLEKVQIGQSIIRQSMDENEFIPDIVSLDAYEFTRRALESSLSSSYRTFEEAEAFIYNVAEAIKKILAIEGSENEINIPDLVDARKFFEIIINYSYRRGIDIPVI
ncbi:MAG TPA: hypothetical protein VJ327_09610 [Patescibacteria group bacterium]|nr:hypothetical protein [Patescibacteria group bacterium]